MVTGCKPQQTPLEAVTDGFGRGPMRAAGQPRRVRGRDGPGRAPGGRAPAGRATSPTMRAAASGIRSSDRPPSGGFTIQALCSRRKRRAEPARTHAALHFNPPHPLPKPDADIGCCLKFHGTA
jgi:hypothetical protein